MSPVAFDGDNPAAVGIQEDEGDYFQLLAQGILAVFLPTEDLRNPCLRALLDEILADIILGRIVFAQLCEATFIFDSAKKACEVVQTKLEMRSWVVDHSDEPMQRLERFGLLSAQDEFEHTKIKSFDLHELFWMVVQYTFLATNAFRGLFRIITNSGVMANRRETPTGSRIASRPPQRDIEFDTLDDDLRQCITQRHAMIDYQVWTAVGTLFSLSTRMPWLTGMLSLIHRLAVHGYGKVGRFDSRLDRCVLNTLVRC